MKIPISEENIPKLQHALDLVQGRAKQHVFTGQDVFILALRAEQQLLGLLTKTAAPGAKASARSGTALPNAYKYSRIVTRIEMVRGAKDWCFAGASVESAFKDAGRLGLTLTPAQADLAVARFRQNFSVET